MQLGKSGRHHDGLRMLCEPLQPGAIHFSCPLGSTGQVHACMCSCISD